MGVRKEEGGYETELIVYVRASRYKDILVLSIRTGTTTTTRIEIGVGVDNTKLEFE